MTVVERLRDEGHLTSDDVRRLALVHAFSAAIGSTDAHLGNDALVVGDGGEVSLAPLYDVLPQVLAPRHDELPDARVAPRAPSSDPTVRAIVDDLAARVRADARATPGSSECGWRTRARDAPARGACHSSPYWRIFE